MAPSHPTPDAERRLVPLADLEEDLGGDGPGLEGRAVQGTVSRSGEVMLLALDAAPGSKGVGKGTDRVS